MYNRKDTPLAVTACNCPIAGRRGAHPIERQSMQIHTFTTEYDGSLVIDGQVLGIIAPDNVDRDEARAITRFIAESAQAAMDKINAILEGGEICEHQPLQK